ncbi:tetratricopeptide repeat protein [Streptomyces sp. PTY087I2]|uniref:AfsR/SARP family transcriptional regulator n=1 Tax=Streptomyces sp. PTY087I2 TaxID=1819298 RepID=UPI0008275066|nr:tetratricopeptide repeat protein [Streptomyces sp. PTY087I2]OCC07667.1 Regulatory protein AfsR [Streptomyces sp. PTY087I2]
MDGRVLGVVTVRPTGAFVGPIATGTTKPAALFALLVTSQEGRCPLREVFDCLWPGLEFDRGRLDQVMRVLRQALGNKDFLITESGVCSLRPPREQIDLYRFRDLLRSAETRLGKDRFEAVSAALAQWPHDLVPLSGLAGQWAAVRREELRRERAEALRAQFEAALRAGLNEWLHIESERWYRALPEEPWLFRYYLMHHGGTLSPSKLKSAISRWTKRFRQPDDELQAVIDRLHGKAPSSRGPVLAHIPNQLPPLGRPVLGREAPLHEVVETVRQRQESCRPTVVVISGLPGIGKSLLANHAAHQLREAFPDGVLFAELGGFAGPGTRPADPESVIDGFLAEFPVPTSPVGLAQKTTALRSVLANRSVLMVLDDAWDDQQVLPLLPGTGASAVLITSRRRLEVLRTDPQVKEVLLGELDEEASTALLQERIPQAHRGKTAREVKAIVEFCRGHPLALSVTVRRFDGHAFAAIHHLHRQLKEEENRLDALDHQPSQLSVTAALACSVDALSEQARCLLWQLAVHPGPSISWSAVLDLGLAAEEMHADRAAEELRTANLVELWSDRYRLHDLVRTFARQRVRPEVLDSRVDFEETTIRQILEHQLQNVWACDQWLDGQRSLPVGEPHEITVDRPEGLEDALAMLDDLYDVAVRGIELSTERGSRRHTWLLPMALVTYQWRRHRFKDAQRFLVLAREAAEQSGVPLVEQAMTHRMLAGTYWHQGNFDLAANQLVRAVWLSEQDSSSRGRLSLARSRHTLALTRRKQGREAEAEQDHRSALHVYRELSDAAGAAAALNGLGTIHHDRGEDDDALTLCTEALDLVRGTTDRRGLADVLRTVAGIRFAMGDREPALEQFRQAVVIYRELGSWIEEDRALCLHADALVVAGRKADAVAALERVMALRELMGGTDLAGVRDQLESLR